MQRALFGEKLVPIFKIEVYSTMCDPPCILFNIVLLTIFPYLMYWSSDLCPGCAPLNMHVNFFSNHFRGLVPVCPPVHWWLEIIKSMRLLLGSGSRGVYCIEANDGQVKVKKVESRYLATFDFGKSDLTSICKVKKPRL